MFCHNCGNEVSESAAFCRKCGTKLISVDAGSDNAQQTKTQDVQEYYPPDMNVQSETVRQPGYQETQYDDGPTEIWVGGAKSGTKSKSKGMVIGIASAAVVVLIVFAIILTPVIRCSYYINKGGKNLEAEAYEDSVAAYDKALSIKPKSEKAKVGLSNAYVTWANALMDDGEYEEALDIINEAAEKVDSEEVLQCKAEVVVEYCDAELALGSDNLDEMSYEQAKEAYEKILEINPFNEDAYLGLIEIEIRTNKFEEALELARKAYDLIAGDRIKKQIDMLESGNIFASNGWIMRQIGYDENKNPVYVHEFTYNLKGEKASAIWTDPDGTYRDSIECTYNEKGWRLVSYWFTTSTGELNKSVTEYDGYNYYETEYEGTTSEVSCYFEGVVNDDGDKLEWTEYNSNHVFRGKRVFDYDENGNNVKQTDYDQDGNTRGYYVMEYNDKGKKIKRWHYNAADTLTDYDIYEYNELDRLIRETSYNADGSVKEYREYE